MTDTSQGGLLVLLGIRGKRRKSFLLLIILFEMICTQVGFTTHMLTSVPSLGKADIELESCEMILPSRSSPSLGDDDGGEVDSRFLGSPSGHFFPKQSTGRSSAGGGSESDHDIEFDVTSVRVACSTSSSSHSNPSINQKVEKRSEEGGSKSISVLGSPIKFDPEHLDFGKQYLGMPLIRRVHVVNLNEESSIKMLSISGSTLHFHCSFFTEKVIPPLGNTSFDVVFLGGGGSGSASATGGLDDVTIGELTDDIYIHTSAGSFRFVVSAEAIANPFQLSPTFVRIPTGFIFEKSVTVHNPFPYALQILEVSSSGGDLHLFLPNKTKSTTNNSELRTFPPHSSKLSHTGDLWSIPPFQSKVVITASFQTEKPNNYTHFIRMLTNISNTNSAGEDSTSTKTLYTTLNFEVVRGSVLVQQSPLLHNPNNHQNLLHFDTITNFDVNDANRNSRQRREIRLVNGRVRKGQGIPVYIHSIEIEGGHSINDIVEVVDFPDGGCSKLDYNPHEAVKVASLRVKDSEVTRNLPGSSFSGEVSILWSITRNKPVSSSGASGNANNLLNKLKIPFYGKISIGDLLAEKPLQVYVKKQEKATTKNVVTTIDVKLVNTFSTPVQVVLMYVKSDLLRFKKNGLTYLDRKFEIPTSPLTASMYDTKGHRKSFPMGKLEYLGGSEHALHSQLVVKTNISTFHFPIHVYNGMLQVEATRSSVSAESIDFGSVEASSLLSATVQLMVRNDNPLPVEITFLEQKDPSLLRFIPLGDRRRRRWQQEQQHSFEIASESHIVLDIAVENHHQIDVLEESSVNDEYSGVMTISWSFAGLNGNDKFESNINVRLKVVDKMPFNIQTSVKDFRLLDHSVPIFLTNFSSSDVASAVLKGDSIQVEPLQNSDTSSHFEFGVVNDDKVAPLPDSPVYLGRVFIDEDVSVRHCSRVRRNEEEKSWRVFENDTFQSDIWKTYAEMLRVATPGALIPTCDQEDSEEGKHLTEKKNYNFVLKFNHSTFHLQIPFHLTLNPAQHVVRSIVEFHGHQTNTILKFPDTEVPQESGLNPPGNNEIQPSSSTAMVSIFNPLPSTNLVVSVATSCHEEDDEELLHALKKRGCEALSVQDLEIIQGGSEKSAHVKSDVKISEHSMQRSFNLSSRSLLNIIFKFKPSEAKLYNFKIFVINQLSGVEVINGEGEGLMDKVDVFPYPANVAGTTALDCSLTANKEYQSCRNYLRVPVKNNLIAFDLSSRHLKDCVPPSSSTLSSKLNSKRQPNPPILTVRRSFVVRNTGKTNVLIDHLRIDESLYEIDLRDQYGCQGYGFRILNADLCKDLPPLFGGSGWEWTSDSSPRNKDVNDSSRFSESRLKTVLLRPNEEKRFDIAFTPDFTLTTSSHSFSVILRRQNDRDQGNGDSSSKTLSASNVPVFVGANYTLRSSIPPHLMHVCSAVVVRPDWESGLYYCSTFCISTFFLTIILFAYIESDKILCDYSRIVNSIISSPLQQSDGVKSGSGGVHTSVFDLRLIKQQVNEELDSSKKQQVMMTADQKSQFSAQQKSQHYQTNYSTSFSLSSNKSNTIVNRKQQIQVNPQHEGRDVREKVSRGSKSSSAIAFSNPSSALNTFFVNLKTFMKRYVSKIIVWLKMILSTLFRRYISKIPHLTIHSIVGLFTFLKFCVSKTTIILLICPKYVLTCVGNYFTNIYYENIKLKSSISSSSNNISSTSDHCSKTGGAATKTCAVDESRTPSSQNIKSPECDTSRSKSPRVSSKKGGKKRGLMGSGGKGKSTTYVHNHQQPNSKAVAAMTSHSTKITSKQQTSASSPSLSHSHRPPNDSSPERLSVDDERDTSSSSVSSSSSCRSSIGDDDILSSPQTSTSKFTKGSPVTAKVTGGSTAEIERSGNQRKQLLNHSSSDSSSINDSLACSQHGKSGSKQGSSSNKCGAAFQLSPSNKGLTNVSEFLNTKKKGCEKNGSKDGLRTKNSTPSDEGDKENNKFKNKKISSRDEMVVNNSKLNGDGRNGTRVQNEVDVCDDLDMATKTVAAVLNSNSLIDALTSVSRLSAVGKSKMNNCETSNGSALPTSSSSSSSFQMLSNSVIGAQIPRHSNNQQQVPVGKILPEIKRPSDINLGAVYGPVGTRGQSSQMSSGMSFNGSTSSPSSSSFGNSATTISSRERYHRLYEGMNGFNEVASTGSDHRRRRADVGGLHLLQALSQQQQQSHQSMMQSHQHQWPVAPPLNNGRRFDTLNEGYGSGGIGLGAGSQHPFGPDGTARVDESSINNGGVNNSFWGGVGDVSRRQNRQHDVNNFDIDNRYQQHQQQQMQYWQSQTSSNCHQLSSQNTLMNAGNATSEEFSPLNPTMFGNGSDSSRRYNNGTASFGSSSFANNNNPWNCDMDMFGSDRFSNGERTAPSASNGAFVDMGEGGGEGFKNWSGMNNPPTSYQRGEVVPDGLKAAAAFWGQNPNKVDDYMETRSSAFSRLHWSPQYPSPTARPGYAAIPNNFDMMDMSSEGLRGVHQNDMNSIVAADESMDNGHVGLGVGQMRGAMDGTASSTSPASSSKSSWVNLFTNNGHMIDQSVVGDDRVVVDNHNI